MNQILALNNPWRVDMLLNKQTKQNQLKGLMLVSANFMSLNPIVSFYYL